MVRYARKRHPLALIVVAVILAIGLIGWRLCRPPALYRMTTLPSLGGRNTHAFRLNDHGQVIGIAYDANGCTHSFLWDRTHGMQDLGFSGGYQGLIINDSGQIAGTMPTDPNNDEAFLWEPGTGRTMLGTLGGKISRVHAMNNRGQIVGVSLDANDSLHAFLWDKETGMKKLPVPDGVRCIPQSINDAGQIFVMAIKRTATLAYHHSWFLLDPNGSRLIDPMPPDTLPFAMNANSCMIAVEKPGSSTPYLLFCNERGTWRRLLLMHNQVTPHLNDRNQIAYTEHIYSRWEPLRDRLPTWLVRPRPPAFEAKSYLWDPARGRIPLKRYLKGIEGFHVEDLNNNGCILGRGHAEDGNMCSILLEPIPERWGK